MITRKIAISAGHSNTHGRDNGAVYNGRIEGDETVKLRNLLVEEFKSRDVTVNIDKDDSVTRETIKLFNEYFGEHDILIDIHFNAAVDVTATGVEVIIPEKYTTMEYALATDLCRVISDATTIRNRGVKTESQSARGSLAWMRMNAETILVEVCFISNKTDMKRYDENLPKLVKAMVTMILNYKRLQIL